MFLALTALIAATVLGGWLFPAVNALLPQGWALMKVNTALAVLLCTASLALIKPKRSARLLLAGRICAGAAIFLAVTALLEHLSGYATGIGTLLAADSGAPMPGRMSIQTACFLTLLGVSLLIDRTRTGWRGILLDSLISLLVALTLALIAGYIFSAPRMVGQSAAIRTSPQTLVCLVLLTLVQTSRRAPYGYFSVLVGIGIGSQFARTALPVSQVLVLLFIGLGERLFREDYLTLPYAAGLTALSMAVILFGLIMFLARKINALERALRDMSLADELTGLHNRRGFYLLGEQALRDMRRADTPLTVFFFDADGLKKINDTLGHDAGSDLLIDIATLLNSAFRDSDVVGRLGGDEFAVIAHGNQEELAPMLQRLNDAIEHTNRTGRRPYRISLSQGSATIGPRSPESFAALVDRADAAMYQDKRQRRAARENGINSLASTAINPATDTAL